MKRILGLSFALLLVGGIISYTTSQADPKDVAKATKNGGGNLIHLASESDLDTYLKNSAVVVDFFATWCPPCQKLGPVIDEVSKEFTNVYFIKIDIDSFNALSSKYGVRSIPTLLYFKDGNKVKQTSGFKNKQELTAILNDLY